MNQDYYIIDGGNRNGPYDLVALVRKIRNGTLTGEMTIEQSGQAPTRAFDISNLVEFFAEKKEEAMEPTTHQHLNHPNISTVLQSGWRFLQRNQISSVFSGLLVLFIILMTIVTHFLLPIAAQPFLYFITFVTTYFLLSCYMLSVMRMVRGQPVDIHYLLHKIAPHVKPLMLASLITSLPAVLGLVLVVCANHWVVSVIGLVIVTIPGLLLLTLYAFAPLLILDQGYGFWKAMETSRARIMSSGMETFSIVLALFVVNFIGGLAMLLPLTLTLPLTISGLAEIYDEMFV